MSLALPAVAVIVAAFSAWLVFAAYAARHDPTQWQFSALFFALAIAIAAIDGLTQGLSRKD